MLTRVNVLAPDLQRGLVALYASPTRILAMRVRVVELPNWGVVTYGHIWPGMMGVMQVDADIRPASAAPTTASVLVGPVVLPVWEVAAVCSQPHLGLEVSEMKLGVSSR